MKSRVGETLSSAISVVLELGLLCLGGIAVVGIPVVTIGSFDACRFTEQDSLNFSNHIVEKNKQLGEKISKQTGILNYEPISVRFEKNDNGTYDMRIFGDSADEVNGTGYSVMKNVVYTNIAPKKVERYSQVLQSLVSNSVNDDNILGENIAIGMGDSWVNQTIYSQHNYDNYVNLADNLYNCIDDAITNSFSVSQIGFAKNFTDILSDEYGYDLSKPTMVHYIEEHWGGLSNHSSIKIEYVNINSILTDVSPVNKEGDKNFVYVNTVQTDDAENLYNVQGCFVVEGADLTSKDVYSRIENGEYNQFVKGEKQSERNSEIIENDVDLTF